jgi:NAD(P)-dependent dehydrogenase (short-subunit alcohol dehydrogenase family)
VALITGGTAGIGLATARVLDEQGYAVTVTGQNPDTIAAAQQELPEDVTVLLRRRPRARRRDLGRRGGPETAWRTGRTLLERRNRADAAGRGRRGGDLRRHLRGQRGGRMAMVAPLAVELAPRGIRVSAVAPAAIDTPAFDKLGLDPEAKAGLGDFVSRRVLAGRMGEAEDVARLVAFLVSPAAGFITGACVPIDGGMGVS